MSRRRSLSVSHPFLFFFPSLLSLSLSHPGCLSLGTPGGRRRLAGGQTSLITSFFPSTPFCPSCPVGQGVICWHLSPYIWRMLSDWEMVSFFLCFVNTWGGRCAPDYNFVACLLLDASVFEATGSTLHLKHVSRYKQEKRRGQSYCNRLRFQTWPFIDWKSVQMLWP